MSFSFNCRDKPIYSDHKYHIFIIFLYLRLAHQNNVKKKTFLCMFQTGRHLLQCECILCPVEICFILRHCCIFVQGTATFIGCRTRNRDLLQRRMYRSEIEEWMKEAAEIGIQDTSRHYHLDQQLLDSSANH